MKKLLLIFLSILIFGCSAQKRSAPITNKFLEDVDISKKLEKMPFQHSWIWQPIDPLNHVSIYIPPVKIDTLDESAWTGSKSAIISSKEEYFKEAQGVADFFREELIKKFENYPGTRFKILNEPAPGVIMIRVALTELTFAHPLAQAGSLAVPVPGAGAALSAVTAPQAAFAMRVSVEGETPLVATAADRKFPPTRVIDLNKLTVTSSAREICSNWAIEIVEAFNKGRFGEVESRGTFKILPW
jgi:hypothetical protein